MFNSIFEIIYLILFVGASIIRGVMVSRVPQWWKKKDQIAHSKATGLDMSLLIISSLGMVLLPMVYIFSKWFDFADYLLPSLLSQILGWMGAAIFVFALYLLYKSHADMGQNFSPELALREEHKLITSGIFGSIRHPMYAAHLVWAMAQIFLLQNWIAGPSFLLTSLPLYLVRIPSEELMMFQTFKEDYTDYITRTGRIFPKIRSSR
ncbi:protein-S-isoprenylcysteine O-methyltransferase, partial [Acidobacteriota bacterium]